MAFDAYQLVGHRLSLPPDTSGRALGAVPDLAPVFAAMADSHGVITIDRARRLGLDRRTERRLLALGIVHRPVRGVVVAGGAPPTWHQRALIAVSLPGVRGLCHGAAARLHGLAGFEDHQPIEVLAAAGYRPVAPPGVVIFYSRRDPSTDLVTIDGIPALDLATTLSLIGAVIAPDRIRLALGEAHGRGLTTAEIRATAETWRRRGRPGPARLLDLLDQLDRRTPQAWTGSSISSAADHGSIRRSTTASVS